MAKNKDGVLKPKYRDLPRYPAIYGMEKMYKDSFGSMLGETIKEIINSVKPK